VVANCASYKPAASGVARRKRVRDLGGCPQGTVVHANAGPYKGRAGAHAPFRLDNTVLDGVRVGLLPPGAGARPPRGSASLPLHPRRDALLRGYASLDGAWERAHQQQDTRALPGGDTARGMERSQGTLGSPARRTRRPERHRAGPASTWDDQREGSPM
ncbi:MAG: hypothetical protein AVDCRST_MAG28-3413, partial [uncultured Rubrobacteraceae bacterium]